MKYIIVLSACLTLFSFVIVGTAQHQTIPNFHDWKPMLNVTFSFCSGEVEEIKYGCLMGNCKPVDNDPFAVECEENDCFSSKQCLGEEILTNMEWCSRHGEVRAVRVE